MSTGNMAYLKDVEEFIIEKTIPVTKVIIGSSTFGYISEIGFL